MGLSLNPANILFKYIDNKKEKDIRIAEFLDDIASEATNLAEVWEDCVDRLKTEAHIDVFDIKSGKSFHAVSHPGRYMNARPLSRLEEFYRNVSSVLDVKHNEKTDAVICKIAKIIQQRNIAKNLVEENLKNTKDAIFFDKNNASDSLYTLENSVVAMHKEAAALHVYAKSFRAKI